MTISRPLNCSGFFHSMPRPNGEFTPTPYAQCEPRRFVQYAVGGKKLPFFISSLVPNPGYGATPAKLVRVVSHEPPSMKCLPCTRVSAAGL